MNIGDEGENLACAYLRRKGFEIIARNYRLRFGEIDIIAAKHDMLVFCEVKSRASEAYGKPFEAVTPYKQKRIRRLAEAYIIAKRPLFEQARFDVISIENGAIDHIENAF